MLEKIKSSVEEYLSRGLKHFFLIITSLVFAFPVLWLLWTSFKPSSAILTLEPTFVFDPTLEGYMKVLEAGYLTSILNSLVIAGATTFFVTIISVLAGYAVSRFELKHKENFFFLALATRMGPPAAFALPFYLIATHLGILDTRALMIVVYMFFNLAFGMWVVRAFMDGIPVELEEAAIVQGYSRFQAFRKIVLPLAIPGVIAAASLVFIFTWNEYFFAHILTGTEAQTFPVAITGFFGARRILWQQVTAASSLATLPALAILIAIRKYLATGLTFGLAK